MGFRVVAHLVREPVKASALKALPRGLKWRVYRDENAEASLVDVFADRYGEEHVFSQDPWRLSRFFRDPLPVLTAFYLPLRAIGRIQEAPPALPALNLRLSILLQQEVMSLASNDDDMDMVCVSRGGSILSIEHSSNAQVLWTAKGGMSVRPLISEEDDPPELVDAEKLAALRSLDGVALLTAEALDPQLHSLAKRREAEFLGGKNSILDLGSFDCLMRVPAPVAAPRAPAADASADKAHRRWRFIGDAMLASLLSIRTRRGK